MLEETLSSTTYSPAEAALTLLSFVEVELAAGGANAEARFFKLFSMLCERVFGVISDRPEENFRHELGGWLSRPIRWERPPMAIASSSARSSSLPHNRKPTQTSSSSTSIALDPVVKLLGARMAKTPSHDTSSSTSQQYLQQTQATALTLIEAMAKEAEHRPNVRYPFPFEALPKSTQNAWLALIEAALGGQHYGGSSAQSLRPISVAQVASPASPGFLSPSPGGAIKSPGYAMTKSTDPPSENSSRLLGSLLRVKPLEQTQLRLFQQNKLQKKDHQRPLQLSPVYNRPISPTGAQSMTSPNAKDNKKKNTTPKIMLSMLEYYLVLFLRYPLAAPDLPPPTHMTSRRTEPYGEAVYFQLFSEYVNYYIQVRSPQGHANTGFILLERPTELFVRITIELWLEGHNQLATNEAAFNLLKERRGIIDQCDLDMSYDLVKATKYTTPPYQIQRCIHKMIARAVTDGAILDAVRDISAGLKGPSPEMLSLSPVMSILQLPFYNYIRVAFRHAPIHAKQSRFYTALNDWLTWLEPWNTKYDGGKKDPKQLILDSVSRSNKQKQTSAPTITYPKATQRSLYTSKWEPYIAANLHLYTVPLAIFLRRAREFDFSASKYRHSLATVLRVFRVFTPEVVGVINSLLASKQGPFSGIVAKHEQNLGLYAPVTISSQQSLKSCQNDMHNLLEEIYLQHLKKLDNLDVIDLAVAKIEGLFGTGAYAGEEKELGSLFKRAKSIVGFPADYEVMPVVSKSGAFESSQTSDASKISSIDRNNRGLLTDVGRQRLIVGSVKCNPEDVAYYGDKMYARPQTHEISFLVPILVNLSEVINAKLGIQTNTEGFHRPSLVPRRFNLRFLADYRNLVFIWIVRWIWNLFKS